MTCKSLALRGALALSLLCGASGAWAQGSKRQVEIKAQGQADLGQVDPKKKAEAEKKGPRMNMEQARSRKSAEAQSEDKFREALELLRKLIASTPDSDPAKPDLYDRLSEMYWQRSSDLFIRAYDREGECLKKANGNKSAEKACEVDRDKLLQSSQKYRDDELPPVPPPRRRSLRSRLQLPAEAGTREGEEDLHRAHQAVPEVPARRGYPHEHR
jgi:hypothetical protein